MSYANWMKYIQNAEKSSVILGKVRKVHYKFTDGAEMLEDYSMETGILLRRAWKKKSNILSINTNTNDITGSYFDWEIELGDTIQSTQDDNNILRESKTAPFLTKRITRHNIEWRIRNLPYPLENYLITTDNVKKVIIIRTTNKKYFKEIHVPELSRCDLPFQQEAMTIAHQHNTLIIGYRKPELVQQMEKETLKLLQEVETETEDMDILNQLKELAN